jgi:(p)ppGpp synthase/HD superfamily hydrolase
MISKDLIREASANASKAHRDVNHLYGSNEPYSYHLNSVYSYVLKYAHLLDNEDDVIYASAAAWTHDLIEDTRMTYNNVRDAFGERIADITYALTNEKGKTRKERANFKYYEGIRNCHLATFVKICDRLANTRYSYENNSSMLNKYKSEHDEFENELFQQKYKTMFQELDSLLGFNTI